MAAVPTTCRAAPATAVGTNEYSIACREDYPVPEPKDDEILVELKVTGICQSDHHVLCGDWGFPPEPGVDCTGHEGAGVVAKLGAGVDLEGETLCLDTWYTACHVNGTYTQYCAIPAQWVIKIPDNVPLEQAGPFMCSGGTAYTAVKATGLKQGQHLVVSGAGGGVGHMIVQFAAAKGLLVIGIDVESDREAIVREAGGEHYIDASKVSSLPDEIKKLTDGLGAHAVIVAAGSGKAYSAATDLLRNMGTVVAVGLPPAGTAFAGAEPSDLCFRGITIRGIHVTSRQDMAEALDLLASGKVKENVTVLPFASFPQALSDVAHSRVQGRQVVDFNA